MSDITSLIQGLSITPEERRLREMMAAPTPMASVPTVRATVPPAVPDRRVLAEAGLLRDPSVTNLARNLPVTAKTEGTKAPVINTMPGLTISFDKSKVPFDKPLAPPKKYTREQLKAALKFTESSNNPNAQSNAKDKTGKVVGAHGLYQFMPDTAKFIAEKAGIPWRGTKALKDPEYNSTLADAYLDYLYKRFDGDVTLVLPAYNRGEGFMSKLMKKLGTNDIKKLFGHLPEETRKHLNTTLTGLKYSGTE